MTKDNSKTVELDIPEPTPEELAEYQRISREVEQEFKIGEQCNMCGKKLTEKDKATETNCCARCIRSSF